RPMGLGHRLLISLEVERVGTRSVTFVFQVRGKEDGELRATVKMVHAFVTAPEGLDRVEDMKSRPVPERLLEGLRRLGLVD
ncbi:MAG: hypothetical protein VX938_00305, partial [Myxococcota bacterium]|nr:hypothetical protein [Myxococcota bacterium]